MNLLKSLLISILLVSWTNSIKVNQAVEPNKFQKENSEEIEKKEVKMQPITAFLSNGFEIVASENELNQVMADLNKDGISYFTVLIASGTNNNDYSNAKEVRFAIYEGQNNGTDILKGKQIF